MNLLTVAVSATVLLGIAMALLALGLRGRRHHSCRHSPPRRKD
ncbi:MAG: hypothetical protein PUA78_02255 [Porphyromonadaceae bacterium]|nr:hypothetical protein [Porphyromonadaceae bacterium]